jgi:hypothetical protein
MSYEEAGGQTGARRSKNIDVKVKVKTIKEVIYKLVVISNDRS